MISSSIVMQHTAFITRVDRDYVMVLSKECLWKIWSSTKYMRERLIGETTTHLSHSAWSHVDSCISCNFSQRVLSASLHLCWLDHLLVRCSRIFPSGPKTVFSREIIRFSRWNAISIDEYAFFLEIIDKHAWSECFFHTFSSISREIDDHWFNCSVNHWWSSVFPRHRLSPMK